MVPKDAPDPTPGAVDSSFAEALDEFMVDLEEPFLSRFRQYKDVSPARIIEEAQTLDSKHAAKSVSRKVSVRVAPFLKLVSQVGSIVSIFTSCMPDPSGLVLGGIMCVLQLGSNYPSYFDKITKLFEECALMMRPVSRYVKDIHQHDRAVKESLVLLYGDILNLLKTAYSVFVDKHDKPRNGLKTFMLSQWKPFEAAFGDIQDSFRLHLRAFDSTATQAHRVVVHREIKRQESFREKSIVQLQSISQRQNSFGRTQVKGLEEQSRQNQAVTSQLKALGQGVSQQADFNDKLRQKDVLRWLSDLTFADQVEAATEARHPETGEWLLQSQEFRDFEASEASRLLWCRGGPGCGKTILSALVLQHFQRQNQKVFHVFCSSQDAQRSDASKLVGSLVAQMCKQSQEVFGLAIASYTQCDDGERRMTVKELAELAMNAIRVVGKKVIVIDGLDECADSARLAVLLTGIVAGCELTKIFVTSRPGYSGIEEAFRSVPTLNVSADRNLNDLTSWIQHKMTEAAAASPVLSADLELQEEVKEAISSNADGMFLWVRFQFESLMSKSTKNEVLKSLEELPEGLEDTYRRAIDSMFKLPKAQRRLSLGSLMYIAISRDTISLDALCDLLAMKPGKRHIESGDRIADKLLVLRLCAGLIELRGSQRQVTLVHSSVRDYLAEHRDLFQSLITSELGGRTPDEYLGCICLDYIFYDRSNLKEEASVVDEEQMALALTQRPFRAYAYVRWAEHLLMVSEGLPKSDIVITMKDTIVDLFNDHLIMKVRQSLYSLTDFPPSYYVDIPTPLHFLVSENFREDLKFFDVERWLEETTSDGRTPFLLAVALEHFDAARTLLDMGVNVNAENSMGETALDLAASMGPLDFCQTLLEEGCRADRPGRDGYTPMALAVLYNNVDVIQAFLEDSPASKYQIEGLECPLAIASYQGNREVVQLLLDHGFDPNFCSDIQAYTPLLNASAGGYTSIIHDLLTAGADINYLNSNHAIVYGSASGLCALHCAANSGNMALMKMLIETGASLVHEATGWTLLHAAACSDNSEILDFALHQSLDLESLYKDECSALNIAAEVDNYMAFKTLLDHGANPNQINLRNGLTLLHAAAMAGSLDMVESALAVGFTVDFVEDLSSTTALHTTLTFRKGDSTYSDTEYLCRVRSADSDAQGSLEARQPGFSSLGDDQERPRISENPNDAQNRALLVKRLLKAGANVALADDWGRTPLHLAVENNNTHALLVLLEANAPLDAIDKLQRTALQRATYLRHLSCAQILLSKGASRQVMDYLGFDCDLRRKLHVTHDEMSVPRLETGSAAFQKHVCDLLSIAMTLAESSPLDDESDHASDHSQEQLVESNTIFDPISVEESMVVAQLLARVGDFSNAELFSVFHIKHLISNYKFFTGQCDGCGADLVRFSVCCYCEDCSICDTCFPKYQQLDLRLPGCRNHDFFHVDLDAVLEQDRPQSMFDLVKELLDKYSMTASPIELEPTDANGES